MAEKEEDVDDTQTPGYVAPEKVALSALKDLDADDEALVRWKAKLLENAGAGTALKTWAHCAVLLLCAAVGASTLPRDGCARTVIRSAPHRC